MGGKGDFGSTLGSFILKTATAVHSLEGKEEQNNRDVDSRVAIMLNVPKIRLLCMYMIFQQVNFSGIKGGFLFL